MIDRVRLSEDGCPPVVDEDDESPTSSIFRLLPANSGPAAKMMVRAAVVVLVLAVAASWAAPKQACASCSALKWKTEATPGVHTEERATNEDGCATLSITCSGTTEAAQTFVEFNAGSLGGINDIGSQSIKLVCGADMAWHYQAEGSAINTISCSANHN
ncbi:hypothetical protein PRIPAC_72104 [Pristionchus pacificus]|uniref:C6 domain-containing protein n=1 Tax=Pristionchus pacificus TaxID=54126 RepID=A0A2A6C771_PRIPA|nr:hypothetical protein PRIPAC_72104 [Pristionchus pacificus]|eukprot:PDM73871.1 hypothetical protein PRIPAC_41227 [Pristionchus pacificus]